MRIYSEDAEKLLYRRAIALSTQGSCWRCIYINLSGEEHYSDALRRNMVTSFFNELLINEEGSIYTCADGDIIIFFQGKATDIVEKVGQQFEDLKCTVYDLDFQSQQVLDLCELKWVEFEKEQRPFITPAPGAKTLHKITPDIVRTARSKRTDRDKLVVLVVEDDPFTRRLVSNTLKGTYEVIEAPDGNTALQLYETNAPDAVFLDIELPDTTGYVVLDKLLAADKSAFVVMLSANSMKENIMTALEKGAQGFATKPFARDKLIHYLKLCKTMRQGSNTGAAHA